MEVRVLGPLRVERGDATVEVAGRRQRALLAALVAADGVVSVSSLIDAVWGEDPPARAQSTLQTYVSRLRALLGGDAIRFESAGYRLDPSLTTDVRVVRSLVEEMRATSDDRHRTALAERALSWWAGPALDEFTDQQWFVPASVEWEELRRHLVEVVADGLVRTGGAARAVGLLEPELAGSPLREPAQVLLVQALHAAGRVTDALRAADRYRRQLREETGLVPGAAFVAAEQRALDGEPITPPGAGTTPAQRRSARLSRRTQLVGRAGELETLDAMVARCALVTVVGIGGIGKTRIVAELIADGPDSDWFVVDLSSLHADDEVAASVGAALGYRAERADDVAVAELLRSESLVVVLDNCEHVLAGVRTLVRTLLRDCPTVRVVATSRMRLDLPEEHVLQLVPLPTTGPRPAAAELFVDRLRRVRPADPHDADDPLVVELCARLDGIPLALELAASRAAVLGVRELAARLGQTPGVLAVTAGHDRRRTLDDVVAWSFDLLGPSAQQVLCALSMFHGEFDLEAAEWIGGALVDEPVSVVLGRLVDATLISSPATGRYHLLEMVKDFGRRQLTEAALEPVQAAHAGWVAQRLRQVAADAAGPQESTTSATLDALRPEIVAALHWSSTHDADTAARIAEALASPLLYRPDPLLAERLLDLADSAVVQEEDVDVRTLAAAARAAILLGDLERVEALVDRVLAQEPDSATVSRAHHAAGVVGLYQGRFEQCEDRFRAAVTASSDPVARLDALGGVALAAAYGGRLDKAEAALVEHRTIAEAIDSDTYRAFAEYVSGEMRLARGEVDPAIDDLTTASDRAWDVGATFVWGIASTALSGALVRFRPATEARHRLPVLLERWRRTATWPQLWTTLRLVAELLVDTDPEVALLVVEAAANDPAAPAVAGQDADRWVTLRQRLRDQLGDAGVQAIGTAARSLDRAAVFARAQGVLAAG